MQDYDSYLVKGDTYDEEMYRVQISFELCQSKSKFDTSCDINAANYLKKNTFRFPYLKSYFNPVKDSNDDSGDMIVNRID